MRLSPDGSKLLSASDDSTVRCWHLQEPMVNDCVLYDVNTYTKISAPQVCVAGVNTLKYEVRFDDAI